MGVKYKTLKENKSSMPDTYSVLHGEFAEQVPEFVFSIPNSMPVQLDWQLVFGF